MKTLRSIAVSLILVVVCSAMLGSDSYREDPVPPMKEQIGQQVRPLAVVRRFKPTVFLTNKEARERKLDLTQDLGESLYSGDTLSTNKEGYALVIFTADGTVAKVKPESMLIVSGETLADSKISKRRIDMEQGEANFVVEPIGSGTFEVATSRSVASVKGTDFGTKAYGYVWVNEGQVDVTALNSGQTISLYEQMYAQVDPDGNNIESGTLSDQEKNNLNEGYDEMDEELIEKTIKVRFRDANGQIREIEVNIFEKGN